jgi:hypothetical protein
MRSWIPDRVRVAAQRCGAVVGIIVCASFVTMPRPNAVVTGRRPAPYGFYIPQAHYDKLLRHHSLMVRTERSMALREMCGPVVRDDDPVLAFREFNRSAGIELPDDPAAIMPAGTCIWLPPAEPIPGSCCITLYSLRDGVVPARTSWFGTGRLAPTYSHAAFDSGSVDLWIYPIPIAAQSAWWRVMRLPEAWPPWSEETLAALARHPELAHFGQRTTTPDRLFSFDQWVGDRSKVARMLVSLPIAEVDGSVRFAAPPKVRWFDAYGEETSPENVPLESPLFLVLVSAGGGALLGYLLLLSRRRTAGPAA